MPNVPSAGAHANVTACQTPGCPASVYNALTRRMSPEPSLTVARSVSCPFSSTAAVREMSGGATSAAPGPVVGAYRPTPVITVNNRCVPLPVVLRRIAEELTGDQHRLVAASGRRVVVAHRLQCHRERRRRGRHLGRPRRQVDRRCEVHRVGQRPVLRGEAGEQHAAQLPAGMGEVLHGARLDRLVGRRQRVAEVGVVRPPVNACARRRC